jgi:acetyl-CoA C-acetyltransferase
MNSIDHLPVIIGAGQDSRPVPEDLDQAFGPADLAGEALRRAFADAGLGPQPIDLCFGVRLFGDSGPAFPNPFGRSNNFPASVCARASMTASKYIYSYVGGQSPQNLVAEAAQLLMDGTVKTVAIVGAEAIANIKAAGRAGAKPDWTENREEPVEDRGIFGTGGTALVKGQAPKPVTGPEGFGVSMQAMMHRIAAPVYFYGLFETARRAALGLSKADYAQSMGALWAAFAAVAKDNEFASVQHGPDMADIITPGASNPMIASPYTKAMVARDGINLGAALLLTTYGHAKSLGVRDVTFLQAHDQCVEPVPLQRARLDQAVAQARVLEQAGRHADLYDLYSCFPVVPLEAMRILGLKQDDVPLTLTGGLPFFGGPGNNYSLHGIAEAHKAVRGTQKTAVVYANGGLASKHAVGRYTGEAPDQVSLHRSPDPDPVMALASGDDPSGTIATYTVEYKRGEPSGVLLIGQTDEGARFYARGGVNMTDAFITDDPIGAMIKTQTKGGQNLLTEL